MKSPNESPQYHNPYFQLQNAHSALVALTKEKDRVIELKVLYSSHLSGFLENFAC